MLKVRLILRHLSALPLALLLASGCSDLADPASPAGVAPPSISASYLDVEEPQSLGSPQLVLENAGLGAPDWEEAGSIGALPDSAWIMIEVRGTVLHTKHPWCDQLYSGSGGCNYTLDGVRLGPLERHGGSGVIVSLQPPGVVPSPFVSVGNTMYAPDGNIHGDVARMVVRNTTGPKVVWFRRLDATPKPGNATTGVYGPMYYMSSDQRVSALVIPNPLRVDAPATVRPREIATFSVSPTSDFKFQMPDGRRHFVYWRYFPGDTATRPNTSGPAQDVPCDNTVCQWSPPKNGRMWAFTYVDGFGVDAKSQVVRLALDSARLELTCDRYTLQRGQEAQCTASVDPGGSDVAWEVTGWKFGSSDGTRIEHQSTSRTWGGVMVKSGTVEVRGRIGSGSEQTATATIQVTDREWPDVPTMHLLELGATGGENGVPPLEATINWASDLGFFRAFPEPPSGEPVEDPIMDVQGGPNDGLYYFADLTFPIWGRIRINDAAMSRGSAFYEAQERNSAGGGTRIGGQQWCSNRVVTSVLPGLVRAHEQKHAEVYRQRYGEVVRTALPELERMTGTYSELADRYEPLRNEADEAAVAASWAIHNQRGNPNRVTPSENGRECNLKNEDGEMLDNPSQPEGESQ